MSDGARSGIIDLMKKLFLGAALAAAAATPAFAADKIDMGATTCKDYTSASAEDIGAYLMWLDGYMSAKTGDTVIDFAAMQGLGTKLMEACQANPDEKILPAIEAAMQGG